MPDSPNRKVDLDRLRVLAAASTSAFTPGEWWLFRRVESIEFVGSYVIRRTVSVDFKIPRGLRSLQEGAEHRYYVPLSVLAKWPPLLSFDLEVDGKPAYLLTSEANAAMDVALLRCLLIDLLGPGAAARCDDVVRQLVETRERRWDCYGELDELVADADDHDARWNVMRVAHSMVSSHVLWVPVTSEIGNRHIAKFAYDHRFVRTASKPELLLRTLAWGGGGEFLEVPHLGQTGSHHINVKAPAGLLISDANMWFLPDRDDDSEPPVLVHTQQTGDRAHVYLLGDRPLRAWLEIQTAPGWRGFIGAAWIAALGMALLLTTFWLWSGSLITDTTSSVAILVIVPAVLSAITLRPRIHPLTLQRLIGVQLLLLLSGSLCVFAALVAIRFETLGDEPARALWRDAAYGAYAAFLLVSVSLICAVLSEWRASRD